MGDLTCQIPDSGRAKRILRIPESHTLYLCPNACGRRQGIRALRNGEADYASFLCFSQVDIVSGDYEKQVVQAVGSLLEAVLPRPRVLSMYVNCIDDFLGTDGEGLVSELQEAYPDVHFLLSHINPIAGDVDQSAAKNIHTKLYDALDVPDTHDDGVTFVGNFEAPLPSCELYSVLEEAGAQPIRQLITCTSFSEYQTLAQSRLVLSLSLLGDGSAQMMEERLGVVSMQWHATYSVDQVAQRYNELLGSLGVIGCAEERITQMLRDCRQKAEEALYQARCTVGDTPVVLGSSASLKPFSAALALLEAGFNVVAVFFLRSKAIDHAAEARLNNEFPHVRVIHNENFGAIQEYGLSEECLTIGHDAAFLLQARYVVDLYHDEGFFGYQGIERLGYAMVDAMERATVDTAKGGA